MFDSAQRMIAVNIIQLLDKQNKLNLPHKNKKEIDKLITLISNELDPKFNQECEVIDSLNYSSCLSLMDEAMGRMEKKKAP